MELRGYLHALRVRWVLVLATTVLGGLVGLGVVLLTTPVYVSTVAFYVSTPPTEAGNAANATQYAQSKVNSYVTLLRSDEVARRVVADQHLDLTPAQVASTVTSSAALNSLVITASVRDTSGARSLAVARGLAATFPGLVDELDNQGRSADAIRVEVVSGPSLAATPVSPQPVRDVGLGLVLGLLLGALAAILRDLLDVSVRSADVAAAATGMPTLAVVDADPEPAGRADAVGRLRTALAFRRAPSPAEPGAEVLVVTSAVAAEGRTTIALDLARSVAATGARVALVEADLRRPRLATTFGLAEGPGLSEVLAGTTEPAAALRPIGDGISVLTAGPLPPNPAELLGSPRCADLVAKLRVEHDLVLLDVAPTLAVTDAAVCAALADGVLLVVRWGRTSRADVAEACSVLRQGPANLLGTVLNGRPRTRGEAGRRPVFPPVS